MAQGRKRRVWSDEEKREVCAQRRVPGVSVGQVVRRYNANTERSLSSRDTYKLARAAALAEWRALCAA